MRIGQKSNKTVTSFCCCSDWSEINKQNLFWKGRTCFVEGNQRDLDAVQAQTSLFSWHGFTGEGKGLLLPLQYNSCVLSDLNKKTPQFTQDFSAMMTPRWKPCENNKCDGAERGEKGTENQQTVAIYSFVCPCQLWERENLVPFSEICHCPGKNKRIKTGSTYWQKLVYPQVCSC